MGAGRDAVERRAGINALTLDYRGYGESEGERIDFRKDPQKLQQVQTSKWPGDIDTAYAYLLAESGVDKNRIGAGATIWRTQRLWNRS